MSGQLPSEQFALEAMKIRVEFAKYGFYGTLFGSVSGGVTLVALAIVGGLLKLQLGCATYIVLAICYTLGVVAFGFLSLWSLPRVQGTMPGGSITIGP